MRIAGRRTPSVYKTIIALLFFSGGGIAVFDILRKTVFVNASWNYNYPRWNFIYNTAAIIGLVIVLLGFIYIFPWLFSLTDIQFSLLLYLFVAIVFTLAFFALPVKAQQALDVDHRGLYQAAVVFVEQGPIEFFSSFHSMASTAPADQSIYTRNFTRRTSTSAVARNFSSVLSAADFIPANQQLATYTAEIKIQKHGPVSALLIVPFLYVFGTQVASAVIGSFMIVATLPVISYVAFKLHFDELESRVGAVLVGLTPALFIFTRHASPVPYDPFTAVLIGLSIYLFFYGLSADSMSGMFGAGIVISLAALTKITAIPVLLIYILLLVIVREGKERIQQILSFASSVIGTHLLFFAMGYNFFIQYGYTSYKYTLYKLQASGVGGGRAESHPSAALNDFLIGIFGTLYNVRWMGPALLILAAVFVSYLLMDWRRGFQKEKYMIGTAMLLPLSTFITLPLVMTGTLSRHVLVYLVPLGFVALCGFELLHTHWSVDQDECVQLGRLSVFLTALIFVINI